MSRMTALYHVLSTAESIAARAKAIAIEQSVEMPLAAITDDTVLRDIIGEVQDIREIASSLFEVRIGLSLETTGYDPGQTLNMLFGNSSLHDDVTLHDVDIPAGMAARFGGPNAGISGLRAKSHAVGRALTCTALKPQGLKAEELGALSGQLARGGLDFIKDDHGLADQAYSPFRQRVAACASAVRKANAETGFHTHYVPNVTGSLEVASAQISFAMTEGIEAVLVEPMIIGVSNFHRLVMQFPAMSFFAHPAMAGALRIAPPLLLGKLFRLFGADVTIYPNFGGRFSYSPQTCRAIADAARDMSAEIKPCLPAPAGGMMLERVPELLDFYGRDTMLLIGGSLLSAKTAVTKEAIAFAQQVARHFENPSDGR